MTGPISTDSTNESSSGTDERSSISQSPSLESLTDSITSESSISSVTTAPTSTVDYNNTGNFPSFNVQVIAVDCQWSSLWINVGTCSSILGTTCGTGIRMQQSAGKVVIESNGGTCIPIPTRYVECSLDPCTNTTQLSTLDTSSGVGTPNEGETSVDFNLVASNTTIIEQEIPTLNQTIIDSMELARSIPGTPMILSGGSNYFAYDSYSQYLELSEEASLV
jgi:hypothetical protein